MTRQTTEVAEGEPIELSGLEYNVQITRFLNPDDAEDAEYLVGQPPAEPGHCLSRRLHGDQERDRRARPSATNYVVTDTLDTNYDFLESESPYALEVGAEVRARASCPLVDTTAGTGPNQGSLLIFKVFDDVSDNRPLKLEIQTFGGTGEGQPGHLGDVEVRRHDLADDRRGDRAAVAVGVDDHHRDDDLRLRGRGEGGEPGVGLLRRDPRPARAPDRARAPSGRARPCRSCRRPGSPAAAAAMPVPLLTTSIISWRIVAAVSGEVTLTGSPSGARSGPRAIGVGIRTPSLAIVCATVAISSGVASTSPWPIADSPVATLSVRSSGIVLAGGRIASVAAGVEQLRRRVEAEAAPRSRPARSPPSSAPSGAKTVLHESAKLSTKVPPQSSSWALAISRPISEFDDSTGKLSEGLTMPASSAPVAVMILKVEPGGCGAE